MTRARSDSRAAAAALAGLLCATPAAQAQLRPAIIDMHLHAHSLADYGGGGKVCTNDRKLVFPGLDPSRPITLDRVFSCPQPLPSAASDAALMAESLAALERHNILAVTSGALERVAEWRRAAPQRIVPAISFATPGPRPRTPAELEKLYQAGAFAVFAEVAPQYQGRRLDDKAYAPYFALAERLDIPVGVHLGEGPPGGAHVMGDQAPAPYRAALGSPFQLEPILVRHPRLRIYVMHYASPLVDEMIAMLFSHPQLYVDIAQNNWGFPRAHFYSQLERLVNAGFEKRILWGSDQMAWPATIETAIRTIEEAPFLSAEQKRDIFHDNAARFLRLPQPPRER